MAQLLLCDLCREIIGIGDKKFIFGYYAISEEDEETKNKRYAEFLGALAEGKQCTCEGIRVVEVCEQCVGIFAKSMNLRGQALINARKELKKMLQAKARKTKREENKKNKEKK
jgi:hypothetical protein